jgi:hypothetical protein
MEGTPMLSIVVGDEDRSGLDSDLDAIVREGARRMLMTALRAEVDEYIVAHNGERDAADKALIVRNGGGPTAQGDDGRWRVWGSRRRG